MAKRPRPAPPKADASSADAPPRYASRGGQKLAAALQAFGIDPAGQTAADLGCSTGGFVDCWLQHDAARVFAVDTAYGQLAWKLRQNPRVTVMERTNALHAPLPWLDPEDSPPDPSAPPDPTDAGPHGPTPPGVDWVSIDLGWTRQDKAVPAALRWLRPAADSHPAAPAAPTRPGGIVTLIKPHYESGRHQLTDDEADDETRRVITTVLPPLGVEVLGWIRSPIRGGKGGNLEHLAYLRPTNR